MPIPPNDQQTAPTRGDLALMLTAIDQSVQALAAAVATLQATAINNGQALAALDIRLTDAGLDVEPNVFGAILTAARTD